MDTRPLAGRGVVITRPRAQAPGLARRIEAEGGCALIYPALEIAGPSDAGAVRRALEALAGADLAIFVSPTAVQQGMALVAERGPWPVAVRVAAVGIGTRRELERQGLSEVIAPQSGADSEALLALAQLAQVQGQRIVIFRGEGGRETLGQVLRARGAHIAYAECYRRIAPQTDFAPLLKAWDRVGAVTAFSSEALSNFLHALGDEGVQRLHSKPVFVPHPRLAAHAGQLGLGAVQVAGPGDEEMVRGLVAYFDDAK